MYSVHVPLVEESAAFFFIGSFLDIEYIYIDVPLVDSSRLQIVHLHCMCALYAFGPAQVSCLSSSDEAEPWGLSLGQLCCVALPCLWSP